VQAALVKLRSKKRKEYKKLLKDVEEQVEAVKNEETMQLTFFNNEDEVKEYIEKVYDFDYDHRSILQCQDINAIDPLLNKFWGL
jgi:hypothetical protein